MKKFILLFSFLFSTGFLFAQESNHLLFKGVPIDGTSKEFVNKMEQKGLLYDSRSGKSILMTGPYANFSKCIILIELVPQKDVVCGVGVFLPSNDTWPSLLDNYNYMKELFKKKYFDPIDMKEEFTSSVQPRDDLEKMSRVRTNECNYFTVFETSKGSIEISINKSYDGINGQVLIKYYDYANNQISDEAALNDI